MITNINPEQPISNFVKFMDDGRCIIMQVPVQFGYTQVYFSYEIFPQFVQFVQKEYDRLVPLALRQAEEVLHG